MASLLRTNFYPARKVLSFGNPKKLDRMNRLDAEAVQSTIRTIFAGRYDLNGPVHFRGGTTPFFLPFPDVSPRSLSSICPKGMRSISQ